MFRNLLLILALGSVAFAGPYNFAEIATCIGSFTSGCTVQAQSPGSTISNSGTVTTSGETVNYSASSVSQQGSLGGSVTINSNTLNSLGPGVMVDALEQVLDTVTYSYAPLNGQTGYVTLLYTLDGTNSKTGSDAAPYACVKLGIGNPTFPFGCTSYSQSSVGGTYSAGTLQFTYGTATPLWFQLESIAGTGFGTGRPTGSGSSSASFFNTATIAGLLFYDQNNNLLSVAPNVSSSLGITYAVFNTPEPSTALLVVVPLLCVGVRRLRQRRS